MRFYRVIERVIIDERHRRMAKPIIMTIDDELQVLNAIERDLRKQFGGTYRILKADSGADALETLQHLKKRNEIVALFLSDQRMPSMTGVEFLAEASQLYSDARKVLLTAYADTQAAIESINTIGLDHYLMKPWDPPEQNLYPVLEDLLSDWLAHADLPYDGIRVAGTLWSPDSHTIKDFLTRNQIPYRWLDIETEDKIRQEVEDACAGQYRLPVIFFPDGGTLIQPNTAALAERIGMHTHASQPFYDLIIVGAGPAGLGAAVYGASEGFRTAMVERQATGGQAGTSSRIENYLGFPRGLSGADLARRATIQAKRFGVEIIAPQEVVSVRVEDPYRYVMLGDGTELSCQALVIATGVSVRVLKAPGVEKLTGAGVYYGAALAEAALYRDQPVFVVGGANSAGQGAMFFSRYASNVTMLVRGTSLQKGMSDYLVQQIEEEDNIEVRTRARVVEVQGEDKLESITIENIDTGEKDTVPAAAMFVFIGAVPHTEMLADLVERNRTGFILTGQDLIRDGKPPKDWPLKRHPFLLETSVPGIFAAGDVRQNAIRRVASAVGEGAIVVSLVHQHLRTV
jgi:thioredoxin reductase (NADPH)